jgi:hypothetical protein
MKRSLMLLLIAFFVSAYAETVTKSSAAFPWPPTSGVLAGKTGFIDNISFSYQTGIAVKNVIILSWSLPMKAEKGNIAIFTLAGTRIASFPITAAKGSVNWNIAAARKPASGVFLATLSYGTFTKNQQILISR